MLFTTLLHGVQHQQQQQSILFSQIQRSTHLESHVTQLSDTLARERQQHEHRTRELTADLLAGRQVVQSLSAEMRDLQAQVKQLQAAQPHPSHAPSPSSAPSPSPRAPPRRTLLAVSSTVTVHLEGSSDAAAETAEAPPEEDCRGAKIVSLQQALADLHSQHDFIVESAFELRQRCNEYEYEQAAASSAPLKTRSAPTSTQEMAVQTMSAEELEDAPSVVKELRRKLSRKTAALEKGARQRRDLEEQVALLEAALEAQSLHASSSVEVATPAPKTKKRGNASRATAAAAPAAVPVSSSTDASVVESAPVEKRAPVTPDAVDEVVLSGVPKWREAVRLVVGIMGDHIRCVETAKHYKGVSDTICAALAKHTPRPYSHHKDRERTTLGRDSQGGMPARPPSPTPAAELLLLEVCLQQTTDAAKLTAELHQKQKSLFVGAMRFHYVAMLHHDATLDLTTRVALEQNMRQLSALLDRTDIPSAVRRITVKQPPPPPAQHAQQQPPPYQCGRAH
jgi:hypothetical protein